MTKGELIEHVARQSLRGYPGTFYGLGCLFSVMKFRVGYRAQTLEH